MDILYEFPLSSAHLLYCLIAVWFADSKCAGSGGCITEKLGVRAIDLWLEDGGE